ncbi:MAG: Spo0B domain-containing protein [Syntrophomonadaceae bacterium]|nr:Spo0B domain-containing protein [Syntrophomonadaceae bacterium]MDD3022286.1 Spo0B domain-containing protein [Syntrophomonadaceae bacterium]
MDAASAVELLRRIRHDFANHLQVIGGYIELARYQDVKDYIAAIVEEMSGERTIFELLDAEVILYLYEKMLSARDLGIILRYDEIEISSINILAKNNEPSRILGSLSEELGILNNEPVINISLYEDANGIEMVLRSNSFVQNPLRIRIKE